MKRFLSLSILTISLRASRSIKDIKDLLHYVEKYVLPVLEMKQDQTIKKSLELLDIKHGRSRTEEVEECVEDLLRF